MAIGCKTCQAYGANEDTQGWPWSCVGREKSGSHLPIRHLHILLLAWWKNSVTIRNKMHRHPDSNKCRPVGDNLTTHERETLRGVLTPNDRMSNERLPLQIASTVPPITSKTSIFLKHRRNDKGLPCMDDFTSLIELLSWRSGPAVLLTDIHGILVSLHNLLLIWVHWIIKFMSWESKEGRWEIGNRSGWRSVY